MDLIWSLDDTQFVFGQYTVNIQNDQKFFIIPVAHSTYEIRIDDGVSVGLTALLFSVLNTCSPKWE